MQKKPNRLVNLKNPYVFFLTLVFCFPLRDLKRLAVKNPPHSPKTIHKPIPSDWKIVNKSTTFNGGSLGSCIDEERCELRYVMRIAQLSESSNLWTHIALGQSMPQHAWSSVVSKPHTILFMFDKCHVCQTCSCVWKRSMRVSFWPSFYQFLRGLIVKSKEIVSLKPKIVFQSIKEYVL